MSLLEFLFATALLLYIVIIGGTMLLLTIWGIGRLLIASPDFMEDVVKGLSLIGESVSRLVAAIFNLLKSLRWFNWRER